MIPQPIKDLKAKLNEQLNYARSLKSRTAQKRNYAKASELRAQLSDICHELLPAYGVAEFPMMLETIGGASGIDGPAPFETCGSRLTIYTPDFQTVVGTVSLDERAFGIEPTERIRNVQAREPHTLVSRVDGKEFKV